MNLATMDYFIALAEERSFTRAAERLHVTQQTLSAHIANIERELGVQLVNRKVPLTLTNAGDRFLTYARRFQATKRALDQEFLDIANDERGLLGIGIAATRGHMLLPSALSVFQEAHPGINALIMEGENQELIEFLREGRVDMVVASVPHDFSGFVVHHLYDENIVLLLTEGLLERVVAEVGVPAEEAVSRLHESGDLSVLGKCPYMLLGERDEPGRTARRLLARSGVRPWVRVRSTNSETLVDLASKGVGACFVPMRQVKATFGEGGGDGLVAIELGPDATISIDVAWRDGEHVWSVIESFHKTLRQLYAE